jgi:hypothetical protein
MIKVNSAARKLKKAGLGFERVEVIPGSTYRDSSTVIIIPTRGQIDQRVVTRWLGLLSPMNQKRAVMFATGHEVGIAYCDLLSRILVDPELSKWKYIMTLEDDNLPPPDAHIRLLETIEGGRFDAVSGLYFTKGSFNMPMAYGDPAAGALDFRPRDVRAALANGEIMQVNGIAMGCALWRMDLFREITPPWFVTVSDVTDEGTKVYTQDLNFCQRAVAKGKRFAVDMRVKVGHLDVATGEVY